MKNKFLEDLILELNSLSTREEKIETLIFYGNQFNSTNINNFNEDDKVAGCTSETYLKVIQTDTPTGGVIFKGTSDSLIVKGYLYILTEAYKGYTPEQIEKNIENDIKELIKTTHIDENIMPSRVNTILNLVIHIKKHIKSS
jgi:cysteine desulfuration protein SufE